MFCGVLKTGVEVFPEGGSEEIYYAERFADAVVDAVAVGLADIVHGEVGGDHGGESAVVAPGEDFLDDVADVAVAHRGHVLSAEIVDDEGVGHIGEVFDCGWSGLFVVADDLLGVPPQHVAREVWRSGVGIDPAEGLDGAHEG